MHETSRHAKIVQENMLKVFLASEERCENKRFFLLVVTCNNQLFALPAGSEKWTAVPNRSKNFTSQEAKRLRPAFVTLKGKFLNRPGPPGSM
ncbi:hypothetical protein AVEN_133583-1 [Araneus ventricosus]|uniref:Uncharacterized protein n=1 Tax=Araneus ventricosus TaxID=182803 RepID=A0A4Y2VMD3_ARAVE|nr:hypothetical protein AVEN_133583-1 [Araneus ventricosus]